MAVKPEAPQQYATVRLPREMVRRLGILCQHGDMAIGDTVAGWIEARVNREYKSVAEKMHAELGEAGA